MNLVEDRIIEFEWDSFQFQENLDATLKKLNLSDLSHGKVKKIKNELDRSDITVKNKLKFVIPLLFIKYEGELEFSSKQKTPKTWKEWKTLFFKRPSNENTIN